LNKTVKKTIGIILLIIAILCTNYGGMKLTLFAIILATIGVGMLRTPRLRLKTIDPDNPFYTSANKAFKPYVFPNHDTAGNDLMDVYCENLIGVTENHDNTDPQFIIPTLQKDQKVLLISSKKDENTDYAVKVTTISNKYIGFLPKNCEHSGLQEDVFARLQAGKTVLAKIDNIYNLDDEHCGCTIAIARYEKTDPPAIEPSKTNE
jgi:hypothetical protein